MFKHLIAISATALALMGCANQAAAPVAGPDYNEGIAKSCTATPVDFGSGSATAKITMTNDGWCAVRTAEKDGQPFLLGLMKSRPQHGHVVIQKAGTQTRVEYTADDRFVGTDRFTVALRPRNATPSTPDLTLTVDVEVAMGEGMAAPAPAATKPATTTPRRATTAKRTTR